MIKTSKARVKAQSIRDIVSCWPWLDQNKLTTFTAAQIRLLSEWLYLAAQQEKSGAGAALALARRRALHGDVGNVWNVGNVGNVGNAKRVKAPPTIHAYVTHEACVRQSAVLPGDTVDGVRVSAHGDYWPWRHGKRETIKIKNTSPYSYMRLAARMVAILKEWA